MRVAMALSATGGPWGDFVTYVQEAERLGVALCFVAEAWGVDAVSPLAYLAAKTERILLASGIIEYLVRPRRLGRGVCQDWRSHCCGWRCQSGAQAQERGGVRQLGIDGDVMRHCRALGS